MQVKKCLICNSGNSEVVFAYNKPDIYEIAMSEDKAGYFRKWLRCKQCGFHYSVGSQSKQNLRKNYILTYRDKINSWRNASPEETFQKTLALPDKQSETKIRVQWIKKHIAEAWQSGMTKSTHPPYLALDIGGGVGIFAYVFQDKYWKSYVIDPSKGCEFIKTSLNIPLKQTFYRPRLFARKFNFVSLVYVLEHIIDPIRLVRNIHKDIKKHSFLFLEVPDAISFRIKPSGDDIFNSTHLWMFDPKSLSLLLDRCGFEVISLERLKTIRGHFAIMTLAAAKN